MSLFSVDYTAKYGLTVPHSEVVAAMDKVKPGLALDLGCGNGRNSLYLNQRGFRVSAWDKNRASIARLDQIITDEALTNIETRIVDFDSQSVEGEYDFILSTVVMMFLQPATIPRLIASMQQATRPGGFNLIVAAMDTLDFPCTQGFPFAFKPDELRNYYANWVGHKYNENVGELHRKDERGQRIKLRFATLLAQKNASD